MNDGPYTTQSVPATPPNQEPNSKADSNEGLLLALQLPRTSSMPVLPSDDHIPSDKQQSTPGYSAESVSQSSNRLLPPYRHGRPASEWKRPLLVSTDDFRASLLATAHALAGSGTPPVSERQQSQEEQNASKSRRNSSNTKNPLVDALMQAAHVRGESIELMQSVSVPPLPQAPTDTPPSPSKGRGDVEKVSTADSAMRMIEAVERIAADRVESALRDRVTVGSDPETREKYKQMKVVLRDVVLSALTNSRLIREELASIRQEIHLASPPPRVITEPTNSSPAINLSKSSTKMVVSSPVIISPVVSGVSSAVSESDSDIIEPAESLTRLPQMDLGLKKFSPRPVSVRCARLQLSASVLSPSEIEKLLTSVSAGAGRETVRLSVGQPTVHPKAFIVVVIQENLATDEWARRLQSCSLVDSYDANFPTNLPFQPGHPWEVRIRSDMASVTPRWVPINMLSNSIS